MITDHEARLMVEELRQGLPGAATRDRLELLLRDREERMSQLADLRRRVELAFRYLDDLCGDPPRARRRSRPGTVRLLAADPPHGPQ
jgi:hypothetical protein